MGYDSLAYCLVTEIAPPALRTFKILNFAPCRREQCSRPVFSRAGRRTSVVGGPIPKSLRNLSRAHSAKRRERQKRLCVLIPRVKSLPRSLANCQILTNSFFIIANFEYMYTCIHAYELSYIRNCVGSRQQKFVATLSKFGQYDTWMTDGFGVQVCVCVCVCVCARARARACVCICMSMMVYYMNVISLPIRIHVDMQICACTYKFMYTTHAIPCTQGDSRK